MEGNEGENGGGAEDRGQRNARLVGLDLDLYRLLLRALSLLRHLDDHKLTVVFPRAHLRERVERPHLVRLPPKHTRAQNSCPGRLEFLPQRFLSRPAGAERLSSAGASSGFLLTGLLGGNSARARVGAALTCAVAPDAADFELGPFTFGQLPILPSRAMYNDFVRTYSERQAGSLRSLEFRGAEPCEPPAKRRR